MSILRQNMRIVRESWYLLVLLIIIFATMFIPPIRRRVPHADDFPQLTQKCQEMHLRYRIWCYSSLDCYAVAWPDRYDFFDTDKVSSWTVRANTKQAVAESLVGALESCPNTPPSDSKMIYDSGTKP